MSETSNTIEINDPAYQVIKKGHVHDIPNREAYAEFYTPLPVFHPYALDMDIHNLISFLIERNNITLVDKYRLSILKSFIMNIRSIPGEIWECGVYRGGTARFFAELIENYLQDSNVILRLFDTFDGMPETDASKDIHRAGDFSDTSVALVKETVGERNFVVFHPGFVPDTFLGLESRVIRLIHIDLDIYEAIKSAVAFAYPRMPRGGIIIFDDYGFASCPGARLAVDEFFLDKIETPIVLPTGQAFVIRQG